MAEGDDVNGEVLRKRDRVKRAFRRLKNAIKNKLRKKRQKDPPGDDETETVGSEVEAVVSEEETQKREERLEEDRKRAEEILQRLQEREELERKEEALEEERREREKKERLESLERLEKARAKRELEEKERAEAEAKAKVEAAAEAERVKAKLSVTEKEAQELERVAAEKAEQERVAAEKAEQERVAAEKAEQERVAAEKAEQERVAAEKAAAEKAEKAELERVASEKAAAEKAEQEKIAAVKAEQERIAAEKAAAEKAEQERIAAEKAEQERIAAEKAEQERIVAAEKAEQERIAAERAEQEKIAAAAAEKAEQERLAALPQNTVDVAVIGGGVSGLTAARSLKKKNPKLNIQILEKAATLGGRVNSDVTSTGFTLDRGFAVFIDSYPESKKLLNIPKLKLQPFQPGAFVVTSEGWKDGKALGGDSGPIKISRVADPLRRPMDLFSAVLSPVGTFVDKVRVIPLLYHVFKSSVDEIFDEAETSTLVALKERWGFSDQFICQFFAPFLQGIYLADLNDQSSRMFHFIFKCFSEGSACLPEGGMKAVPKQLEADLSNFISGMDIATGCSVSGFEAVEDAYLVKALKPDGSKFNVKADKVILATEASTAYEIMDADEPARPPQRSVGCIYYSLSTQPPVKDPILVLNGEKEKGTLVKPINNLCFPSVVSSSYAPPGKHLCSVTILGPTMDLFRKDDGAIDEEKLDAAVRSHLVKWFPEVGGEISNRWETLKVYDVMNAQPAQFGGKYSANFNGGRKAKELLGVELPENVVVCGDHQSSATLNGALESAVNAAKALL
ncbi:hypothetical protein TrVE_jg6488 [Triparma verrucosa]|uniref:Amine oxidase n=1 Tax=Triparma verrucosa TaxID=1606542 RepID=A0A9W7EN67_9STRA|nr:hypothetical protein TrVE_jg6488 [Triparma verrucosa]